MHRNGNPAFPTASTTRRCAGSADYPSRWPFYIICLDTNGTGSGKSIMKKSNGSNCYYLGCPAWADKNWIGSLLTNGPASNRLAEYSRVFSSVEGNTVFYGVPKPETVERWIEAVEPNFRFAFKFPKAVSHERQLIDAQRELAPFLDLLERVHRAGLLGPSYLQLSPYFSRAKIRQLESFLRNLPSEFSYAVEVRHLDFFDNGPVENELNQMLTSVGVGRVLMDVRPLFTVPTPDASEQETQRRKPNIPIRFNNLTDNPIVRLIGSNDLSQTEPYLAEWAGRISDWIRSGVSPFIFVHTADNRESPKFARRLHERVVERVPELAPMALWPGESNSSGTPNPRNRKPTFPDDRQKTLF